jgi:hypothetical protein
MAVLVVEWYPKSFASLVTTETVRGEYLLAPGRFDPGRLVG